MPVKACRYGVLAVQLERRKKVMRRRVSDTQIVRDNMQQRMRRETELLRLLHKGDFETLDLELRVEQGVGLFPEVSVKHPHAPTWGLPDETAAVERRAKQDAERALDQALQQRRRTVVKGQQAIRRAKAGVMQVRTLLAATRGPIGARRGLLGYASQLHTHQHHRVHSS